MVLFGSTGAFTKTNNSSMPNQKNPSVSWTFFHLSHQKQRQKSSDFLVISEAAGIFLFGHF
jgi:hypothetical protein